MYESPNVARRGLAVVVLLLAGLAPALVAQKKGKPRLDWADSVILAVEEAKLRNVPIVLHIHGDT